MVLHTVDPNRSAVVLFYDATRVPVQFTAPRVRKHRLTILGAEHKVIENLRVSGHNSTPSGLAKLLDRPFTLPQVSPTANDSRSLRDRDRLAATWALRAMPSCSFNESEICLEDRSRLRATSRVTGDMFCFGRGDVQKRFQFQGPLECRQTIPRSKSHKGSGRLVLRAGRPFRRLAGRVRWRKGQDLGRIVFAFP